jgi:hypothetical protein
LQERREELEQAVLARVYGVGDPTAVGDPEYLAGLRGAVRAALSYGIDAIEEESPRIPQEMLDQARQAARSRVSLDTVLRRYFAGHAVVSDFLVQEAERAESFSPAQLQRAMRKEARAFDRLLASVADAYTEEVSAGNRTAEQRQAERVRMVLEGAPVDPGELEYDLDSWHVGMVASGAQVRSTLRAMATTLDCRLLLVPGSGRTIWAWLGGRRKTAGREVVRLAESCWPETAWLTVGEPGQGLDGWRLSHRQAKAAAPIAPQEPGNVLRYLDVAILASALNDDVLAESLSDVYLAPLERERDGGAVLRDTLDAYFEAGRNASSAAARLGVNRKTVSVRLQAVEEAIGRQIDGCAAELETAVRLWGMGHRTDTASSPSG